MAVGPTAPNSAVELSTYMRNNLSTLLGIELSPASAQNLATTIVQHVAQLRPGGPGVVLSRDLYETFVSVQLESGPKISCCVSFDIKPDGRRVIRRIRRSSH
ncbi:MAG: hypothetical protein ACK4N4_02160 [Burkholderiales bacterium]